MKRYYLAEAMGLWGRLHEVDHAEVMLRSIPHVHYYVSWGYCLYKFLYTGNLRHI